MSERIPVEKWTLETLKCHLEKIISIQVEELDARIKYLVNELADRMRLRAEGNAQLIQTQFDANKEAILKAENAAEKRFENLNGFRGALSDQAASFLPRVEFDGQIKSVEDKISAINSALSKSELEIRECVTRNDLKPLVDAVDKLRDANATIAGKNQTTASFITSGIAVFAIVVSLAGFLWHSESSTSSMSQAQQLSSKMDEVIHQLQLNRDVQNKIATDAAQSK